MNFLNLMGVRLTHLNNHELWTIIESYLQSSHNHLIVTANPEFILTAQNDKKFRDILNSADLALPDGVGLILAARVCGCKLQRHTGADLTADLVQYAQQHNLPIAIINWRGGLLSRKELSSRLQQKYPHLNYLVEDVKRSGQLGRRQVKRLTSFQPIIIFSTLGAPWQEYFLNKERDTWPSCRLMMGVGGSFDFLLGAIARAPKIWRHLGLEWLWRLGQQPWRFKRIWRAVIVFSYQFIIWKLNPRKIK